MGLFSKFKKDKSQKGAVKTKKETETKKVQVKDEMSMADLYSRENLGPKKVQKETKTGEAKKVMAKAIKGDTKNAYKILIKPIVSEKASFLGQYNQYIFEVAIRANKIEIKKAIKALYGVDAVKVNIINLLGKNIRSGRSRGRTKKWKKAIITLKPGQSIQVYEGV